MPRKITITIEDDGANNFFPYPVPFHTNFGKWDGNNPCIACPQYARVMNGETVVCHCTIGSPKVTC